ncbi:hypothetical protein ABE10_00695, partial [Bacillus toyonensis]|nr:hypothetical protein [Bacillus toyonensis]
EDVHLGVDGHREGEAQEHPGGVVLDLGVDELLDLAELHDRVEALLDLLLRHAEDRRVQEDVLAPGEVGVEAGAHLDEAGHASSREHAALVGTQDAGDELEHRRLARAVVAEERDRLAFADLEGHAVESLEVGGELLALHRRDEGLFDGVRVTELEVLVHVVDDDARAGIRGLGQSDPPDGGTRARR